MSHDGHHGPACKMCPPDKRAQLLDDAKSVVTVNRNKEYGEPEDNFRRIAKLWNAYLSELDRPLEAHDTAVLMVLLKVARIIESPSKRDNWLDGAGYLACGFAVVAEQPGRVDPSGSAGATAPDPAFAGPWR